jgi:hypothetical protein
VPRVRSENGGRRKQDCSEWTLLTTTLSGLSQAAFFVFFFLSVVLGAGGGVGSFLAFLLFLSFSGDDLAATGAFEISLTGVGAGLSPVLRLLVDFGGEGALTGSGDDSDSVSSSTTSASSSTSSSSTGAVTIDASVSATLSASSSLGTGFPAL